MSDKRTKYTAQQLEAAKRLYMEYEGPAIIEQKTGVKKHALYHYVKGGWRSEREMLKAELFDQMSEAKRVQFTSITSSAVKIMERALKHLATRDVPPTVVEATKASDILNVLDKITRLDDGNPTDIVSNQEKPLTIETVRKKLAADPFQIEDAKVKKISEKKDD